MDSLRLILLIAGVILVIGIYVSGHLAHRRKAARSGRRGRLSKGAVDVSALAGLRAVDESEGGGDEIDESSALEQTDPLLPDPSLPIIALTLIARRESMSGSAIIDALEAEGLKAGPMRIYHYRFFPDASEEPSSPKSTSRLPPIVFSIANATEPGVLDPKTLHEERIPGLVIFMNASDPAHTMRTLDAMLGVGVRLARRLDAILGDAQRNYLTPRAREALREHALNLARNRG
ncbi:cell division protein ZipA C-terminal FtsZ-binding domain-containing protein [Thioalkalivibrio sp. HK1]|uniref:cell division protein ZipA C-terminal FtsZ-binding domain-containing protein n=1 Tax=Thioalkalivibrio sp. HK1 TaxID=1469245 RepID=UPI00046E59CE|nr:cell division protein ZipA C-terminal FtsZ-binding domain-containing protein [Thioalkalivibrio sp. HK1]